MADKKTTDEFKEAFVGMLGVLPNITAVCRLMGINASNIRMARKADKEFNAAVLAGIEEGYDMIVEEARRRAVDGVVEPQFYKGCMITDESGDPMGVRKYSDKLLEILLKGYRPKIFNPGAKFSVESGEKVSLTFNLGGD